MPELRYRPDIDGLRALAVGAVVIYHAFPEALGGGFSGVDVFFVISGYLISGLILTALEAGTFSYRAFYARRVRRLFPSLLLVLSFVSAAGGALLTAEEYRGVLKHVWGGATFMANVLFWTESGYFNLEACLKPLGHLWSLGVEEQFYILWPFILVFLFRHPRPRARLAGGLFLASFAASIVLSFKEPSAGFYLPFARFWELMTGFFLFRLLPREGGRRLRDVASALGLFLLALSFGVLREGENWPGWQALIPAIGTALLIGAGPQSFVNAKILGARPMVAIGKMSYALYLWHWPFLSYAYISFGKDPPLEIRTLLILLAFFLSWATYRFVERPIRFGPRPSFKTLILSLAMAVMALWGAWGYRAGGFPTRFAPEAQMVTAAPDFAWENHVRMYQCHIQAREGLYRDPSCLERQKPMIALWGDSNAASLYPGLKRLQEKYGFGLSQLTQGGCPPIFDLETLLYKKDCNALNAQILEELTQNKPTLLLLTAAWKHADYPLTEGEIVEKFDKSLRQIRRQLPQTKIVVMGPTPRWPVSPQRTLFESWAQSADKSKAPPPYQPAEKLSSLDAGLRRVSTAQGAAFVSILDTLCKSEGCLAYVGDKPTDIIGTDPSHLSKAGSDYFVEAIKEVFLSALPR